MTSHDLRAGNSGGDSADSAGWLRRVGCVSTTRADSGIYRPLLTKLVEQPDWRVFILAGGTHHSEGFGRTVDGFSDIAGADLIAVDHLVPGDDPVEVAATAGRGLASFSQAFAQADLDLVFVLGDRSEMLAAATAALIHRIPIAHLHGGDLTLGAYDDQCRHAITKLSHLHFPAVSEHADRIIAMGEDPRHVHTVGALALDAMKAFEPEPIESLSEAIGLDFSLPTLVVALHPETLSDMPPVCQVETVLSAVGGLDANLLLIGPNADVGHVAFSDAFRRLAATRSNTVLVESLPQARFWSCLAHARLLVGNSSAGMLEAVSFGLPVVNIGDRQAGRIRSRNVIDVPFDAGSIVDAVREAASDSFRKDVSQVVNPYGDGCAAGRIVEVLRRLPDRNSLLKKQPV